MNQALRLRCDASALTANYLRLQKHAGTSAGAAVKADGYGLGAEAVAKLLLAAGCRDFFVSTWWEAEALQFLPPNLLSVLHGLGPDDAPQAGVRPVLVSPEQVSRWKSSQWADEPCDVMIDTGMNRLGLRPEEVDVLGGLHIDTLHSHLACADEEHALNQRQLLLFQEVSASVSARRYSLANSAGIFLGGSYSLDLVRPGLSLYGGIPRPEARDYTKPVATIEAQVIQLRSAVAGETIGYNATAVAERPMKLAVINIGYADGYWRAFSSRGTACSQGVLLPVVGRVSMDLVTLDVTDGPLLREGDWVELDFDLERSAKLTGMSQYELLTGLGRRYQRIWS